MQITQKFDFVSYALDQIAALACVKNDPFDSAVFRVAVFLAAVLFADDLEEAEL
jgi:hypothetical protein